MNAAVCALVTNCSARKSAQSSPGLSSVDLNSDVQDAVARQWIARVRKAEPVAAAGDLYKGRGAKRMWRLAKGLNAPLYIASAGLGLLEATECVPAYDLSVSSASPSSVQRRVVGGFDAAAWWEAVQQSKYAVPIVDLFTKLRGGLVLIAVSNAYVPLLVKDLLALPKNQRQRLRLFGSGDAKYPPDLRSFLMPYDARLDVLVRGSKVDFAQRAAEHFINGAAGDQFPTQLDQQRAWVETALSRVEVKVRQKRQPLDDAQIREFAREMASQGLSYTSALNTLRRRHGIACEQGRFRRLFREATA